MQRHHRSNLRYAPPPPDTFEPYRWLLGDIAGRSLAVNAVPQRTRRAAWMLALLGVLPLAAVIVGGYAPAGCKSSPLPLHLGQSIETTMTLTSGIQCSVQVLPGTAGVEQLTVDLPPQYGTLSPRGMTGMIYRPDARFSGRDSFSFSLRGKTARQAGTMTVSVHVFVK